MRGREGRKCAGLSTPARAHPNSDLPPSTPATTNHQHSFLPTPSSPYFNYLKPLKKEFHINSVQFNSIQRQRRMEGGGGGQHPPGQPAPGPGPGSARTLNASLLSNASSLLLSNDSISMSTSNNATTTDIYAEEMKRHAGHDQVHSTMALILMLSLLLSQYLILFWKNSHPKSFAALSTIGMWFIPPLFALYSSSWRFLLVWTAFGVVNAFVIWKASERPLSSVTPRLVYKWYATAYSFTYGLGGFASEREPARFCRARWCFLI